MNQPLQPIEAYNVVHLGDEASEISVYEDRLKRQSRQFKWMLGGIFLGALGLFFSMVFMNHSLRGSLGDTDTYVASLIEEIGQLNQRNFELTQQMESQESVLQIIESEFTQLENALSGSDQYGELESLFSNVLGAFETEEAIASGFVQLAEVPDDGTFDVLIVGTRGAHTDTMIVASINTTSEKITLFSIPRDLYINGRRINQYYYYYGVEQLQRMIEAVTGLEMDHYAKVDMEGFQEIIDVIGGIDIYVDEAIYDGLYPNEYGGYSPYSIDVGHYHMDGEQALRYARSRKSTSDFDRAGRQQKILSAVRVKVLELNSELGTKDLTQLFQTALEYTESDLSVLDLISYYFDYRDYQFDMGFVLSNQNYLYSMINESGAYILLPKAGDFEEIHQAIQELVN